MTDRDRLIELISDTPTRIMGGNMFLEKISEEIADYLLANGFILPPCKVGDSCYPLNASETELTCEEKISRITISERNIIIGYYEHWDYYNRCRKADNWRLPLRTRILGKGVFLTKEAAEEKIKELEKLQTLPVGYTSCLKNKEQRGKGIGNGWTVDVIAHILSSLKEREG